jgi:hypothetical protein
LPERSRRRDRCSCGSGSPPGWWWWAI